MADVARGHGGDCFGGGPGGGPPDGSGHWRPPNQCEGDDSSGSGSGGGRGKRGKTRNVGLRKIIAAHSDKLMDIAFEEGSERTYRPIGDNADRFSSLVGTIVDRIPPNYTAWRKVPQATRDMILPEIRNYFDMEPHIDRPGGDVVQKGILLYCGERYRDHKYRFKQKFFDKKGGEDRADILDMVPPNVAPSKWSEYVRHFTSPATKRRSTVNKGNKAKQHVKGHGGRTSLPQFRYKTGSAIEGYRQLYTDARGAFVQPETEGNYAQMIDLERAQAEAPNPMTGAEIIESVLKPRRGWRRGIGPTVPGSSSDSTPPPQQPEQRMFTLAEVEGMITDRLAQEKQAWQSEMMTDLMSQFQSQISSQVKKAMKEQHVDEETESSSDEE